MTDHQTDEQDIYLTLHRTIDAPVEKVFAAWTNPEQLRRWFAPDDAVVARAIGSGTTRRTVTHSRLASSEARDNHEYGWINCLAKLEAVYAVAETGGSGT